jgi:NDP-sugar pyrophosphorylase family protein
MKVLILAGGYGTRISEETSIGLNRWLRLAESQFYGIS